MERSAAIQITFPEHKPCNRKNSYSLVGKSGLPLSVAKDGCLIAKTHYIGNSVRPNAGQQQNGGC